MNGVTKRPAEATGLGAAAAVLIAYAFGLEDPAVFAALVIVVGAAPAAVTWLVVLLRRRNGGGA